MEIATGVATDVSKEVAKGILQEAIRHVRYVIDCKKNLEEFKEKLELLKAKRESAQQRVDVAKRNLWDIEADVDLWCYQVDEAIYGKLKREEELEEETEAKCCFGVIPAHIKTRYRLSKKAVENVKAVNELLARSQFYEVAVPSVPKARFSVPEYVESISSTKEASNKIIKALKDPANSVIGVHGLAGMGKTTLVKEVARQIEKDKVFDPVVIATVTQDPNIEAIQNHIAESLGLIFQERSVEKRAEKLRERLKNERKILLILDDIWEKLNLEKVGIPFGDQQKDGSDEEKLGICKILLTSRARNVLTNEMGATEVIPINILDEGEALGLFNKIAGNVFEKPELETVANEVAKKCGRVPLTIVTVASALRNKGLDAWKAASQQLQTPSPSNFTWITREAYLAIKLSYNHLGDELKQTLLLCCLLGKNAHIQDLLRCALGLQLFDRVKTVERTRIKVLDMVSNLKDSCLLLDGYNEDRFIVHDLVCDVALAIAYEDNHAFALEDEDDFQDKRMEEFKWVSSRSASIKKLPDKLECPQLALLSMGTSSDDSSYVKMPNNFFEKMKRVKVLDLMKMDLWLSPAAISLPTSLRTLCLKRCLVEDMANLGELKNLRILSLSGSAIEMLPKEIRQLTYLRSLDLSYCTKLRRIPPGVLSSLSRLEELDMSFVADLWNQPNNARLDELKELSSLITLHIQILEAKIVPKGLFFERLQRYKILIGGEWDWLDKVEYSRTLKLRVDTSIDDLDHGFKHLLKKAEALSMENLEGVRIVLNQLGNKDCFLHLNHLHIGNASDIQYIISDDDDDDDGAIDKIAFCGLRSMTLENLPQLISFCSLKNRTEGSISLPQAQHDELPLFGEQMELPCLEELNLTSINVGRIWHNQFSTLEKTTLTSLIIQGCGNLKYVLSSSMATSLVYLKSFEVVDCQSLREIISTEDIIVGKKVTISFPQLNSLKMKDLRLLIGYCSENYNINFPSLSGLNIDQCPEFKGFIIYKEENQSHCTQSVFNGEVVCPKLDELRLTSINVQRVWPDPHCYAQSLKWLFVERCHNLRCLFASSMMPRLTQLKGIIIKDCTKIEEVISTEGVTEEVNKKLPNLTNLLLRYLPRLMTFCHGFGSYMEFPLLEWLAIHNCPSLKTFISDSVVANETPPLFNEKVAFPRLEYLRLAKLENCTKIWHDQLVPDSFSKLNQLLLLDCNGLEYVFPFIMSKRLRNLEVFRVVSCDFLEEIFETLQVPNAHELHGLTATQSKEETAPNFVFPKLTFLQFRQLPRLKSFHRGIHTTEWPSLKKMVVYRCGKVEIFASDSQNIGESKNGQPLFWVNKVTFPNLEELRLDWNETLRKIWHGQLRADFFSKLKVLGNLTALEVSRCHGFINLLSCSTAKSLVQLTRMSITDCDKIVEVIAGEGDEVKGSIIFTHLKYLQLSCLPSLASFCLGKHGFEFPALEKVIVIGCPDMKIFSHGCLSTPMLQRVQFVKSEDEGCWEGNLNATIQWLFAEKVIGKCGFGYVTLSDSSKLLEIWRRNPQGIVDFKRLTSLKVYDCSGLRCLFTISMALDLPQLGDITVKNCIVMERIIEDEGTDKDVNNKTVFPRLRFITLESCGSLASFYRGSKILECRSLKGLKVADCPQMFAFASTFSKEQRIELIDDGGNKTMLSEGAGDVFAPAFFNSTVVCPNLKILRLSSINVERVWDEQLQADVFSKLRVVELVKFPDTMAVFPHCFIQLLPNLEKLVVSDAAFSQIFNLEGFGGNDIDAVALTSLKELSLAKLPQLTHLWKEEYSLSRAFCELRSLEVLECHTLKTLVPSSVSFGDLRALEVSKCHGIVKLIACSTAKSLVQLTRISITDCDKIEEIIGGDGDEMKDCIVFTQLKYLQLSCLPSLYSFCLRDHVFEFPALEKLIVKGCQKMRIFCQGDLSTPELQKLMLTEDEENGRWDGNLKTTIKQLFEEMNTQNSKQV